MDLGFNFLSPHISSVLHYNTSLGSLEPETSWFSLVVHESPLEEKSMQSSLDTHMLMLICTPKETNSTQIRVFEVFGVRCIQVIAGPRGCTDKHVWDSGWMG